MKIDRSFQIEAEAARQFALERYDILDTPQEYCFDHIAQTVKLALDVPIVAISMIDGERQWFKSTIGFELPEMPRKSAICNYTINQNNTMIVEDTILDRRFKESPMVVGYPFLRSYIGVPLTTPDGHNIGVLCALDIVPRQFTHSKIELLEQLAELVIHELEMRQQADKDRLTGALTRSGFSVKVQKAIALYDRQEIKSTMVLFDIDLHKMVRHYSGHLSGNALLRTIIRTLIACLKPSHCVGRMGGKQFAVLLTSTTQSEAMTATKEFLKKMDQTGAGIFLDVSFSEISPAVGICDDWIKQANIDLRAAKPSDRSISWPESDKHLGGSSQ
ncbi:diguanylate cyclase domain-containing protein [Parasphingorhabdus sp.]|uniref:sensor domain-containing diguanylate cyclase n=1 Tax=Parasphingorhabdus sp. TaxID=2709688 RepID=UPI003A953993